MTDTRSAVVGLMVVLLVAAAVLTIMSESINRALDRGDMSGAFVVACGTAAVAVVAAYVVTILLGVIL